MKRPLVWVGIAYVGGEILSVMGLPFWAVLVITGMIILMTGRMTKLMHLGIWLLILPVFCLFGSVNYRQASVGPAIDNCFEETMEVSFSGRIWNVNIKENSAAIYLPEASIKNSDGAKTLSVEKGVTAAKSRLEGSGYSDHIMKDGLWREEKTGLILYVSPETGKALMEGDEISGVGTISRFERASNPGQFDSEAYYRAMGYAYRVYGDSLDVRRDPKCLRYKLGILKRRIKDSIESCMDSQDAGLVEAMILGDQTLLDPEIKDLYRDNGIIHMLAISGLHISIIGMGCFKLLFAMGLGFIPSATAASLLVILYAMMISAGITTKRAVIMFIIHMGGEILGRSYDLLSALALSVLLLLWEHPLMLTQSAFQFSYMALMALGILLPALDRCRKQVWGNRPCLKNRAFRIVVPALCVTLMTMPLTAFYYGRVPLYSLFLNLLILPMAGIMVPLQMLIGLMGTLNTGMAALGVWPLHAMLRLITSLCRLASTLPGALWLTGSPPAWVIIMSYGTVIVVCILLRVTGYRRTRAVFLFFLCLLILLPFRRMEAFVAFLDVGQGDAILLRSPEGKTYMIDGGSTTVKSVGKYRIDPFLTYYGEKEIDYALVSHGDEDHMNAVAELIEMDKIRHLILTTEADQDEALGQLISLAGEKDIPVQMIGAGASWQDAAWSFECLSPEERGIGDSNDRSMVLKLTTEHHTYLFTGDISADVELKLPQALIRDVDVLKVAHHGSRFSTTEAFLDEMNLDLAVISAGKGNHYGHPHTEVLKRLEMQDIPCLSTIEKGCIIIRE